MPLIVKVTGHGRPFREMTEKAVDNTGQSLIDERFQLSQCAAGIRVYTQEVEPLPVDVVLSRSRIPFGISDKERIG